LQSVQPQGPYQLGGWSIGGVIAMEMAQQLQAQDQDVVLLALIDSYAPTGDQGPEPNEITLLMIFAQDMGLPWRQIPLASDHLARLEPDQQLACALEQARRANVVPPDMDLARVRRLFQVFKNNFWAVRQYVPHSYSGAVTLFKACEQLYEEDVASDLGWGVLVDGGVTVHEIAGNHYTLVREPHVEALAGALRKYLFL
jgi:thioesterase domain-containing protein